MHDGLSHVLSAHGLRVIEEIDGSVLRVRRILGQIMHAGIGTVCLGVRLGMCLSIGLALVALSVLHLLLRDGEHLWTSSMVVHRAMIFGAFLVLLDPSHPGGVSAVVLFLVHHHCDLIVASVGLVVCLVVVPKALHHQLFAVSVTTDLVLVGSLVVAYDLVDLRDDLSAVVIVALEVALLLHTLGA